jgi:hypothetical protein
MKGRRSEISESGTAQASRLAQAPSRSVGTDAIRFLSINRRGKKTSSLHHDIETSSLSKPMHPRLRSRLNLAPKLHLAAPIHLSPTTPPSLL